MEEAPTMRFSPEPVPQPDDKPGKHSSRPDQKSTMARELHKYAQGRTPPDVNVPTGWAGIVVWALGEWGPWAFFVFATWFLYQDNKAGQAQILEVAKTQIAVNSSFVVQMTDIKNALTQLVEEAKRAHKHEP